MLEASVVAWTKWEYLRLKRGFIRTATLKAERGPLEGAIVVSGCVFVSPSSDILGHRRAGRIKAVTVLLKCYVSPPTSPPQSTLSTCFGQNCGKSRIIVNLGARSSISISQADSQGTDYTTNRFQLSQSHRHQSNRSDVYLWRVFQSHHVCIAPKECRLD
jgi:hypothetical protein